MKTLEFKISIKAILLMLIVTYSLNSCTTKDQGFCACLQAGKDLNNMSVQLLKGKSSPENAKKLRQLKEAKNKACKEFQFTNGPEMLQKKATCEAK